MLNLAPRTLLPAKEPFNAGRGQWAFDGLAERWFEYAPALDQRRAGVAVKRLKAGRTRGLYGRKQLRHWLPLGSRGKRLLIKDPIAAVSSEWLAQQLDASVVVLVRHPAAFAHSLRRMDWRFDFRNLVEQPLLIANHLSHLEDAIKRPPSDLIGQAGLLWLCINTVLASYADRNPDWIVVSHEGLSLDPVNEFREIYSALELDWSDGIRARIEDHTGQANPVEAHAGVAHELKRDSASNVSTWHRHLSQPEISALRAITEPLAGRYYGDDDWMPSAPTRAQRG